MKEKIKKALKRAYRRGRKEGFDKGFNTARMIYEQIAVDQKREIEELNSELILGQEEDNDGICEEE